MLHHLRTKLSLLLILIPSIVFSADNISISNAFIKKPRPGVDVTAGFATINSNIELKVMKVSNKNFKNIELHSMKMNYGVMEMRKLTEPKLGPNSPLVLTPGSDHLMIIWYKQRVKIWRKSRLNFSI